MPVETPEYLGPPTRRRSRAALFAKLLAHIPAADDARADDLAGRARGFGELAHGLKGILQDYACVFGVDDEATALEMVRLASMGKRLANSRSIPARRLGAQTHRMGII